MDYTKEQLTVAKEILLNLITDQRELNFANNGICHNASQHKLNNSKDGIYFYGFIPDFAEYWPNHSGFEMSPIKEDIQFGKWEGKNLELRIDLMKYIVSKIDNLLEGM